MDLPQRDTLRAVIDCIIPADDWPSASQNHADDFILKITETDLSDWRATLVGGLIALDDDARRIASTSFIDLPPLQQHALLAAIENDPLRAPWFEMMIRLTNEGYYADRSNGGNLEHVSWSMIGYDPRLPPGLI